MNNTEGNNEGENISSEEQIKEFKEKIKKSQEESEKKY